MFATDSREVGHKIRRSFKNSQNLVKYLGYGNSKIFHTMWFTFSSAPDVYWSDVVMATQVMSYPWICGRAISNHILCC